MRFLHAADIHLDSPQAGMTRRDPELARLTASSTRDAFGNLVDAAIANDVAFLLIAGDLYDTEQRNYETGLFFAREMQRLGRPCIMIHGNHDSAAQITKSLQPPPNVTVLPTRKPGQVGLAEHGVVIHGQSFAAQAEADDLAARYPDPVPGAFNIGLLHSSVEDPGEHARYAPCRVETLVNKNYGYWALGHIHTRATLHEHPHIHFPGNTQGRHVRETGPRGATLVDVADGIVQSLTPVATDVLRWAVLRLDISGVETLAELAARLRFALAEARLAAEGRPLIARVVLTGATLLHAALLAQPGLIDAECRAAAEAAGPDVHIERAKLQTRPAGGAADFGALEEAVRAALADPGLVAGLLTDFARLGAAIPSGASAEVPHTEAGLAALQDDAWSLIRHALEEGGPGNPAAGPHSAATGPAA
jgi:hypothetical protein